MGHTHRVRTAIARSASACVLAAATLGLSAPALADQPVTPTEGLPVTQTTDTTAEPAADARAAEDVPDETGTPDPAAPAPVTETTPDPAPTTAPEPTPAPQEPALPEQPVDNPVPALPEQPADPADPADSDPVEAKDGATPTTPTTPTTPPVDPNETVITPPSEDDGVRDGEPTDPISTMPVVQLGADQVAPAPDIESAPTVVARPSTPPSEDADRTSVTCEVSGTTSVSPDPACRAVDLETQGDAPAAPQVERVEVVTWAAGDVQPKLTLEPATDVPTQVTGIKLTLLAPAKESAVAAPTEVRVTVLDEAGNAAAFEVPTAALAENSGRPQTFVVKFDSAQVSPQIAEGKISRVSIGGASQRTGAQSVETGAVVLATEFLAAPATVPPVAPPTGNDRPGTTVPPVPTAPTAPRVPAAPPRSPAPTVVAPRVPAQQATTGTARPAAPQPEQQQVQPQAPNLTEDLAQATAPAESAGQDAAAEATPTTGEDQRLDAVPFGPAALPPNLVTLLQTTGIALAILGSMALITAEERRRRRLG